MTDYWNLESGVASGLEGSSLNLSLSIIADILILTKDAGTNQQEMRVTPLKSKRQSKVE